MDNDVSRRQLFRMGPFGLLKNALQADSSGDQTSDNKSNEAILRPPGAIADEVEFKDACTACGKCAEACEYKAIFLFEAADGTLEGTPYMDADKNPCTWCKEKSCIHACDPGALRIESNNSINPIGIAELAINNCMTSQGTLCDDCSLYCPSEINAIKMLKRKPILDQDLCTGCGMCLYHCPAEPVNAFKINKQK